MKLGSSTAQDSIKDREIEEEILGDIGQPKPDQEDYQLRRTIKPPLRFGLI